MIKYSYKKDKDKIQYIKVSGHANYDTYNKDIVCAGISSIIISHINLIERFNLLDKISYSLNEGIFELKVLNNDEILNTVLENIINSIKNISNEYPKKIMEE